MSSQAPPWASWPASGVCSCAMGVNKYLLLSIALIGDVTRMVMTSFRWQTFDRLTLVAYFHARFVLPHRHFDTQQELA